MPLRPDQDGLEIIQVAGALVRKDGSPIAKTGSGNTHTVAAGSTTAVFTNTTFDGGAGGNAYTIGDIVAAAKAHGLLT